MHAFVMYVASTSTARSTTPSLSRKLTGTVEPVLQRATGALKTVALRAAAARAASSSGIPQYWIT